MRFRVSPRRFVLLGTPRSAAADLAARVAAHGGEDPWQVTFEPQGATLFATEEAAASIPRPPGTQELRGRRLISFVSPMGWNVVGFLARVTTALAEAGVPLGAICGFDYDHLFVEESYLERARAALRERVCREAQN